MGANTGPFPQAANGAVPLSSGIKYAPYFLVLLTAEVNMEARSKKSRAILKAVAQGKSFEQILGRYPTLNYHDIFRAAAEAPLSHWSQRPKAATMADRNALVQ